MCFEEGSAPLAPRASLAAITTPALGHHRPPLFLPTGEWPSGISPGAGAVASSSPESMGIHCLQHQTLPSLFPVTRPAVVPLAPNGAAPAHLPARDFSGRSGEQCSRGVGGAGPCGGQSRGGPGLSTAAVPNSSALVISQNALHAARQLADALHAMAAAQGEASRYLTTYAFALQAEGRARQLIHMLSMKAQDSSEEVAVAMDLLQQSQRQMNELLNNQIVLSRASKSVGAVAEAASAAEVVAMSGVGAVPAMAALMTAVMVTKKAIQAGRRLTGASTSPVGEQAALAAATHDAAQRALACTVMAANAQMLDAAGGAGLPAGGSAALAGPFSPQAYGRVSSYGDMHQAEASPAAYARHDLSASGTLDARGRARGGEQPPPASRRDSSPERSTVNSSCGPTTSSTVTESASALSNGGGSGDGTPQGPGSALSSPCTKHSSSGTARPPSLEDGGKTNTEVLRQVYDKPLKEAAQLLSVSVMSLKRSCRAQGVKRWPFRKLSCLGALEATISDDAQMDTSEKERLVNLINLDKAHIMADANHEMHPALNKLRLSKIKAKYEKETRCKKRA